MLNLHLLDSNIIITFYNKERLLFTETILGPIQSNIKGRQKDKQTHTNTYRVATLLTIHQLLTTEPIWFFVTVKLLIGLVDFAGEYLIYYTSPQSLLITFSYSLAQQLWGLIIR